MSTAGKTFQAEALLGTWVKLPAVEVVELVSQAGMDFVIIDLEHATLNIETVSLMIGSSRASGLRAYVRVPQATPAYVQPLLDAGAAGIVVPHVDDVAAARSAVRAIRFPPLGNRGASPSGRAGSWGSIGLEEYLEGGSQITVIAQVESDAALESIESIASVPGIDMVFIGEADLAASRVVGLDDVSLRRDIQAAEATCREKGIALGGVARDGSAAADRLARGYSLVVVSTDLSLLRTGAAVEIEKARGTGGQGPGRRLQRSEPDAAAPSDREARADREAPAITMTPADTNSKRVVRDELLELITAVWFEIDTTDGTSVSSYFASDATLTISRARVSGTAEIDILYAQRSARGPRVSRHCVSNLHVLEASRESARAVSALLLFAEDGQAPRHRTNPVLVADVEDTFVRVEGRWLIQDRHIKPQFMPQEAALAVPTE